MIAPIASNSSRRLLAEDNGITSLDLLPLSSHSNKTKFYSELLRKY
tara:strand:+ start:6150 stop:6287 length:138 start_codon:yes stop_codon:yes gene_type:complete